MIKWLDRIRRLRASLAESVEQSDVGLFHQAIGGALTTWAIMETRLVLVASLLLKLDPQKTGLIFYSVINFQVWIALITELFPMEPDFTAFQRRWNKIAERLRAEKDHRDRLAHEIIIKSDPILKPSPLDFRSKSRHFRPLTFQEVITFRDRIGAITDDIGSLLDDMRPYLGSSSPRKSS